MDLFPHILNENSFNEKKKGIMGDCKNKSSRRTHSVSLFPALRWKPFNSPPELQL